MQKARAQVEGAGLKDFLRDGKVIDVTMWMDGHTFPGNPECKPEGPFNRVSGSNREYVYDFESCTQTGTHIQGPHYFLEDGRRINEFGLSAFEGMAVVVDVEKRGVDTTRADFVEKVGSTDLQGKIIVLRTGHMEELIAGAPLDSATRPGIAMEAAQYLVQAKGVRMIAIDSVGVESRVTVNYDVNRYLCENGMIILEGLVNLGAVSQREVFLQAFPLKIRDVEGTPCRAIIRE